MNKKIWLIFSVVLVFLTFVIVIFFHKNIQTKEVVTEDFQFTYDTTWKIKKGERGVTLQHKKTKSKINIQSLVLDSQYIDVDLDSIIQDITYGIEEQNEGYELINTLEAPSDIYDSYSYLYEKDMEQALVNVYKKDNKVVIAYFSADSEVFDILLDSVDEIFRSIELKVGEEIELT